MSTILVVAEHRRNELRPVTFELISAAQGLKKSADDKVVVAVIGSQAETFTAGLSVNGVDEILTVPSVVSEFDPDIYETAVAALIEAKKPVVVLLAHSVDTLGYAATLASKAGHGFAKSGRCQGAVYHQQCYTCQQWVWSQAKELYSRAAVGHGHRGKQNRSYPKKHRPQQFRPAKSH